jgi:hypothetical protein
MELDVVSRSFETASPYAKAMDASIVLSEAQSVAS